MDVRMDEAEPPIRKSLFCNVPPFLNYLPNGGSGSLAGPCKEHTDVMVELRESLWRIPMAFNYMVNTQEEENINKEKCRKIGDTSVNLPKKFLSDTNTDSLKKRKCLFPKRQSCLVQTPEEEDFLQNNSCTRNKSSLTRPAPSPALTGVFSQQHDDSKSFMEQHTLFQLSPFPTFQEIGRKDKLWLYYKKMRDKFGWKHYDFLSPCLVIPQDRKELMVRMKENPHEWWIVKPPGRNNGSGIHVINRVEDIPQTEDEVVVQKYLASPYLIKGCKFDLRVYVVITSIDPLRIYIYDEGLVRFCVKEYSMDPETIGDSQIHVCNYAVNKDSDKFTDNEDPLQPQGHKWTLSGLWNYFSKEPARPGCLTPSQLWTRVEDMVIKSVLCGLSSLRKQAEKERRKKVEVKSSYNTYKIFGYDILLDSNRVPHLIEINSRPCALSDKLDAWVNRPMVSELFKLVGYHIPPGSLATMDKKITACTKLNIPYDFSQIGYNPTLYWNMLDSQGATKQKRFKDTDRDCYIEEILKELTANDVRVLVKTLEEYHQAKRFNRVFPTANSYKYFQYFDSVSYYDKLLDAFEDRFSDKREEGIEFIDQYCKNNVHL